MFLVRRSSVQHEINERHSGFLPPPRESISFFIHPSPFSSPLSHSISFHLVLHSITHCMCVILKTLHKYKAKMKVKIGPRQMSKIRSDKFVSNSFCLRPKCWHIDNANYSFCVEQIQMRASCTCTVACVYCCCLNCHIYKQQ